MLSEILHFGRPCAFSKTRMDWIAAYHRSLGLGKRPWRNDLHQRYMGVVNSKAESVNKQTERPPRLTVSSGLITAGGGEGNQTPGLLRAKKRELGKPQTTATQARI